jgi:hypothetical protein
MVEPTHALSEFRLKLDRTVIVNYAVDKRRKSTSSPDFVDNLLNHCNRFFSNLYVATSMLFRPKFSACQVQLFVSAFKILESRLLKNRQMVVLVMKDSPCCYSVAAT